MLGWITSLGLGWVATLGAPALPYGGELVAVPALPVQPTVYDLDARGNCAVLATALGFLALTTDEGQSFRFVPRPAELRGEARLLCAGDRFFITRGAELLGLVGDSWQRVGPTPGPSQSQFRGVVQAPGVLYVGTGNHVLAARGAGMSFTPVLAGVDALTSDGKDVFAAKEQGVYRVGPDETLTLISKLNGAVRALGSFEGALFASTERQLFHSEDAGKTWQPVAGAPPGIVAIEAFDGNLLVQTASGVQARDAKGKWSKHDTLWRAHSGTHGLWVQYREGPFGHLSKLGEPPSRGTFPKDPMPTVRALAAHEKTLVVALYRPSSIHVSADSGKTWQSACPDADVTRATLDGTRLQLASMYGSRDAKKCSVPGLRTRFISELPSETCNDDLCVRFSSGNLLRSRDRGKTWQDLTANAGGPADIVGAAAAGREIIIARRVTMFESLSSVQEYSSLFRSLDDGRTFAPLTLPFKVTAFAAGDEGWFFGTHLYGVVRLPYAARAVTTPADRQGARAKP